MSLIGLGLIVLALIVLFLMRERPGAANLINQPFPISMIAAAVAGLFAVGAVMAVAGLTGR
jgi:hypothetical protein